MPLPVTRIFIYLSNTFVYHLLLTKVVMHNFLSIPNSMEIDMAMVLKSDRAATSKFLTQEKPHYYSTSSPPFLMCLLILPSPKAKTPPVHCVNKCEFM